MAWCVRVDCATSTTHTYRVSLVNTFVLQTPQAVTIVRVSFSKSNLVVERPDKCASNARSSDCSPSLCCVSHVSLHTSSSRRLTGIYRVQPTTASTDLLGRQGRTKETRTNLTVAWESEPELEAAEGCSAVGEGRDTVRAGGCRSSWVPVAPESNSRGRFGNSHAEAVPSSLRSLASLALEDLRLLARLPRCTCRRADSLPPHPLPLLPSTPPGLDVCV